MKCPHCLENGEESMCFAANNLELSAKLSAFYDEDGVYIEPKPVPLFYACWNGHVFRLEDTKTVNEQNLSVVPEPIPVSG